MTGATSHAEVDFSVTPQGFRELLQRTAQFDKKLAAELRKNIRTAATSVISDIRHEVQSGSYANDAGMRAGIAAGLKVQISTSKAKPGVRIVATKSQMPEGKQSMVRAWQRSTFRHPVWGNPDVYVNQSGHPYFDGPIASDRDEFTRAVLAALKAAADMLAGIGAE